MKIAALVLGCSLAPAGFAQCTPNPNRFCVTFPGAYAINNQFRGMITLTRGETYTFQMVGTPSLHPFHISTSPTGGGVGAGHWSDRVVPAASGVSGNATLTFTVGPTAPSVLYYQCFFHIGLGGMIMIEDPICPADFNADGSVDFFDYDDFVNCFEGGTCPTGRTADFNDDGSTDFFDYDDFVVAFEQTC